MSDIYIMRDRNVEIERAGERKKNKNRKKEWNEEDLISIALDCIIFVF